MEKKCEGPLETLYMNTRHDKLNITLLEHRDSIFQQLYFNKFTYSNLVGVNGSALVLSEFH